MACGTRAVLNTFQSILRTRTRGTNIVVAQRHKRKRSIFDKLHRIPGMQLSRMDDIAGCRLIFHDLKDLYAFRKEIHEARFKPKRRIG
jgi:putative GTP pyrophosphokinase